MTISSELPLGRDVSSMKVRVPGHDEQKARERIETAKETRRIRGAPARPSRRKRPYYLGNFSACQQSTQAPRQCRTTPALTCLPFSTLSVCLYVPHLFLLGMTSILLCKSEYGIRDVSSLTSDMLWCRHMHADLSIRVQSLSAISTSS